MAQRYEHNPAPEPEVAYLFLKRKTGQSLEHFNIDALERRLRRAKKEQPHTIALWNQIGNFWRIKGNAGHAIECFRRALSVAPTNADTLLNLARVLFNLQYLDDAISLTKRSLEVHPPDRSAWRQYFTLGEIFKAYGQLSDAILHLKQALALHPHYEPIRRLIAEAEKIEFASNTTRMQFYTGLIIAVLVSTSSVGHGTTILTKNFVLRALFQMRCRSGFESSCGSIGTFDLRFLLSDRLNVLFPIKSHLYSSHKLQKKNVT